MWETTPDGHSVRRKKEKTLGAATKPKHEVIQQLAEYIAEHTGKLAKQGESISTFGELWTAFTAVKSGQWSKKTKENLACLFAKHVLPQVGRQRMRDVTLTSLQLLLNKLAEDRFSKSVVSQIRTYVKSCFEYAVDEDLIPKSPARVIGRAPKLRIRWNVMHHYFGAAAARAMRHTAPETSLGSHPLFKRFGSLALMSKQSVSSRERPYDLVHFNAPSGHGRRQPTYVY